MTHNPSTAAAGTPPRFVNIAYWLFLLVALIHVVSLVVALVTFGTLSASTKSQLTQSGTGLTAAQADGVLSATLVVAIVIGVLFTIAFVVFDLFMRRGANWARIVLLIATILSLAGVTGAYGIGALSVIVAVIATVLMFLRPSSEYFQATKARKAGAAPTAGPAVS